MCPFLLSFLIYTLAGLYFFQDVKELYDSSEEIIRRMSGHEPAYSFSTFYASRKSLVIRKRSLFASFPFNSLTYKLFNFYFIPSKPSVLMCLVSSIRCLASGT